MPVDYAFPHKKYQLIRQANVAESVLEDIAAYLSNICFNLSTEWARKVILVILAKRAVMPRFDSVALMAPYRFHNKMQHGLKARQITLIVMEKMRTELIQWYKKFSEVEHFVLILGAVASGKVVLQIPRTIHTFEVYPAGNLDTVVLKSVLPQIQFSQIKFIGLHANALSNFGEMFDNFGSLEGIVLRQPYHHEYGIPLIDQIVTIWRIKAIFIVDGDVANEVRNKIIAAIDESFNVEENVTEIGKITFMVTKTKIP